jgi:peptide-methionine (R)-S-oxide reductase
MKTYSKNPEAVSKLTSEQYRITPENGTERPFQNEYWDNKEPGLYVDVVSGEPLFASADKFDSGTDFPSVTKPLEPGNVVENVDRSHGMTRTHEMQFAREFAHRVIFMDGGRIVEQGPQEPFSVCHRIRASVISCGGFTEASQSRAHINERNEKWQLRDGTAR